MRRQPASAVSLLQKTPASCEILLWKKSKQNNACTAVPVRKGRGGIMTYGTPSRISCNERTPGKVHMHTRKD